MSHDSSLSNPEFKIRILGTSDLHMNLCGFDYYSDTPEPAIGLTRTASLIRAARREAEVRGDHVLLFDNGDFLQGTPIGDWAVDPAHAPHILMRAFDALGYDAIGLGNHDFGFGLDDLDRALTDAPCPVLCSNAQRLDGKQTWRSHTILTRGIEHHGQQIALKIGVFSVLPPQTSKWEAHRLRNRVTVDDILTCASKTVLDLKTEGCDLVVALAHTGLGAPDTELGMENAAIPLAGIKGIDAVIAGHSHLTLPGPAHDGLPHVEAQLGHVHGKPVIMPGSAGACLGVMDLTLRRTADGHWAVKDYSSHLRSVCPAGKDPISEDPELVRLFAKAHRDTRKKAAQPVGETHQHLHSYFSFCAPDRGLALAASAQAAGLRPYLQGKSIETLPVLSAIAPSKFGGRAGPRFFTDVPPGQICLRHVNDLYVFPNELYAVVIDAAYINDWLEMSAGVFNQITPGNEANLVDSNRAGHNFDILYGLSYQIDLSQPARFNAAGHLINAANHRIRNVRFNGQPLAAGQQFVVALNNYRANGGGHFPFVDQAQPITLPGLSVQRIVQDYISGELPRDQLEHAPSPFALTASKGATTCLKTGPKALAHLSELAEYQPHVIGEDDEGFLLIRLTL